MGKVININDYKLEQAYKKLLRDRTKNGLSKYGYKKTI